MDVGDLLNILLMVTVIVISIVISFNLPYIAYGIFGRENPFAIYQIAISLNYISSFPGDFNISISYPGIENGEFRIARVIRDVGLKGNSYVSEGACAEKNHVNDLINAIINAAIASIPIEIKGAPTIRNIFINALIQSGKNYIIGEVIFHSIIITTSLISGNFMDIFSSFIREAARERLGYFVSIASEKGTEYAMEFAGVLITTIIKYVLKLAGPWGILASFAANMAIYLASNIYSLIMGAISVEYNCLKGMRGGVQYVYINYRDITFSQNLKVPINFSEIKGLAETFDGWLYKVSMVDEINNKIYVLSNVSIYTKDNEIRIRPTYVEFSKR